MQITSDQNEYDFLKQPCKYVKKETLSQAFSYK